MNISNRIKVSKEATDKMKQLKAKLKSGPLYSIARMGLMYSLADEMPPQKEYYQEDGMDFNKTTFFGDDYYTYMTLLEEYGLYTKPTDSRKSEITDELGPKQLTSYLAAHTNRGIVKLSNRIKGQEDLLDLVKEQNL
ncbi:DndE family protein [Halobacteriovorax sp. CON-3]|uniref:DndE family protein n=1 Tax=Halobacteriovorax sp. CON-3 TaxID=3157710 RepID=UPI003722BA34